MAEINLSPLTIEKDCPVVNVTDDTKYYNEAFAFADFKFHSFATDLEPNATFTYDDFKFKDFEFTGVSIEIKTDGDGNILIPEDQYKALASSLSEVDSRFKAILVKGNDTTYRQWYVRIYTYVSDYNFGIDTLVSANVSYATDQGWTLFPEYVGTDITVSKLILNRNVTLILPNGSEADLGSVKQKNEIHFTSSTYSFDENITKEITVLWCNDNIKFEITEDIDAECLAKAIYDLLKLENEDSKYTTRLDITLEGDKIFLESKSAGVPFNIDIISTPLFGDFEYTNIVGNVSNMSTDGFFTDDSIQYEFKEKGGTYKLILTVLSGCDYNQSEIEFDSWCYDIKNFDCCFIKAIKKLSCKCKKGSNVCHIYNVKRSVEFMLQEGYTKSEIQKVVDLGWSLCDCSDCKCNGC